MARNQAPLQLIINPLGHRMLPENHEIIGMLRLLREGRELGRDIIEEVDLYSNYPEVLFADSDTGTVYKNGHLILTSRRWCKGQGAIDDYSINRVVLDGRWRSGGGKNTITHNHHVVGYYTRFRFILSKEQTAWHMREFELPEDLDKDTSVQPKDTICVVHEEHKGKEKEIHVTSLKKFIRPGIQKSAAERFVDNHRRAGESSGPDGFNTGCKDETMPFIVPRKLRSTLAKSQTQMVTSGTVQGTSQQVSSAPEGKTIDGPCVHKYAAERSMDGHRNAGDSSGSDRYITGSKDDIVPFIAPRNLRSIPAKSQTQTATSGIISERIVQEKSKQISSAPEGKTVDEAVNEGSSSMLKLLSVAEQDFEKSALEKNLGEALDKTASGLSTDGKGILAADESARTMEKRFSDIQVENTESNRRAFRELLFCTSDALRYLSGIIISEETLNQKTEKGVPFLKIMKDAGVLPGIRVDKGTVELDGTNGETITEGLDGLAVRCKSYYDAGVRFAKWRMVLKIGPNEPSEIALEENAISVGRYAKICQSNGLLPLIEPQIYVHGNHGIKICAAVTQRAVRACLKALEDRNVDLNRTIWKLSMVIPGSESDKGALSPDVVAEHTIKALQQTLPLAVPGVVFLTGRQSEEEATLNLNAINQHKGKSPWTLSFSFGRALQHSTLRAWLGKRENVKRAQEVFVSRCKANSQASLGRYVVLE